MTESDVELICLDEIPFPEIIVSVIISLEEIPFPKPTITDTIISVAILSWPIAFKGENPTTTISSSNIQELKKKRGRKASSSSSYFGQKEEEAIREYLTSTTTDKRKNELFRDVIETALRKLIKGILKMPKFQKILGVTQSDLEEDTYYHILFLLDRFELTRKSKTGQPAKAFSYYGTCAKNYILNLKIINDGIIAKHGTLLDVNECYDKVVSPGRNINDFEELRKQIISNLDSFPIKYKFTKNDVIVIQTLKYMLLNWHLLDFHSKNDFVRLLVQYTQLSANVVSTSLKKIKTLMMEHSDLLNRSMIF